MFSTAIASAFHVGTDIWRCLRLCAANFRDEPNRLSVMLVDRLSRHAVWSSEGSAWADAGPLVHHDASKVAVDAGLRLSWPKEFLDCYQKKGGLWIVPRSFLVVWCFAFKHHFHVYPALLYFEPSR